MSSERGREVVLSIADARRLTLLEAARACVLAGVRPTDTERLIARINAADVSPEEFAQGATFLYALAFELALREEPGLTWAEAQRWHVVLDLEAPADDIADDIARERVAASLVSGLPPDQAELLTVAELEHYRKAREELGAELRAAGGA